MAEGARAGFQGSGISLGGGRTSLEDGEEEMGRGGDGREKWENEWGWVW